CTLVAWWAGQHVLWLERALTLVTDQRLADAAPVEPGARRIGAARLRSGRRVLLAGIVRLRAAHGLAPCASSRPSHAGSSRGGSCAITGHHHRLAATVAEHGEHGHARERRHALHHGVGPPRQRKEIGTSLLPQSSCWSFGQDKMMWYSPAPSM